MRRAVEILDNEDEIRAFLASRDELENGGTLTLAKAQVLRYGEPDRHAFR